MTETGKQLFHHSFNSREDKMENLLTSSPSIGDTTENHTSEHTVQSVIMIVIDHFILDLVVLGFFSLWPARISAGWREAADSLLWLKKKHSK